MADPIIELISENDQNDNLATRLISNYSDSDSDDNDNDNTDGDSDGDQQPSFDIEIVIDHGTGTSSTSSMDIKTNSNENLFIQPREPVLCCTCGVKTAIYK